MGEVTEWRWAKNLLQQATWVKLFRLLDDRLACNSGRLVLEMSIESAEAKTAVRPSLLKAAEHMLQMASRYRSEFENWFLPPPFSEPDISLNFESTSRGNSSSRQTFLTECLQGDDKHCLGITPHFLYMFPLITNPYMTYVVYEAIHHVWDNAQVTGSYVSQAILLKVHSYYLHPWGIDSIFEFCWSPCREQSCLVWLRFWPVTGWKQDQDC